MDYVEAGRGTTPSKLRPRLPVSNLEICKQSLQRLALQTSWRLLLCPFLDPDGLRAPNLLISVPTLPLFTNFRLALIPLRGSGPICPP